MSTYTHAHTHREVAMEKNSQQQQSYTLESTVLPSAVSGFSAMYMEKFTYTHKYDIFFMFHEFWSLFYSV